MGTAKKKATGDTPPSMVTKTGSHHVGAPGAVVLPLEESEQLRHAFNVLGSRAVRDATGASESALRSAAGRFPIRPGTASLVRAGLPKLAALLEGKRTAA